jgi:hypothetical protein
MMRALLGLADTPDALERLAGRHVRGKIVVRLAGLEPI